MARVRVVAPSGEAFEEAVLRLVRVGAEAWRPDAFRFEVGDDLTGDGRPNVLIEGYSMGAHCCFSYVLVALGDEAEVVWSASTADASVDLVDLDGDGVPEALTHDMGYAYDLCNGGIGRPAPGTAPGPRGLALRRLRRGAPGPEPALRRARRGRLAGRGPLLPGGDADVQTCRLWSIASSSPWCQGADGR